ncbi:cytochrome c oxidase subunit 7A1, mitochondrial [Brachyhypopomus gauderio]|uniref:cytochrome c oxidase subunit 7A1, mitochondrial n=1 Tax=Brachyhypopomus gauderio TaxID=698409 RepID=UPI004042334C
MCVLVWPLSEELEKSSQRPASDMRHLLGLQRVASQAFSTTARQLRNKVPDNQKIFQADNGLPVHIKGGTTDVLLYRLTMTLTVVGTGFSLYWLLVASMPRGKAS